MDLIGAPQRIEQVDITWWRVNESDYCPVHKPALDRPVPQRNETTNPRSVGLRQDTHIARNDLVDLSSNEKGYLALIKGRLQLFWLLIQRDPEYEMFEENVDLLQLRNLG
jgi:hypothetical protein